jgi:hypothetical protein
LIFSEKVIVSLKNIDDINNCRTVFSVLDKCNKLFFLCVGGGRECENRVGHRMGITYCRMNEMNQNLKRINAVEKCVFRINAEM